MRRLHKKGERTTPEYRAWKAMRGRCNSKSNRAFACYGGRGIRVCARWDCYEMFLEDMGRRPSSGHSLDRIDVNGNYCPNNCRWATMGQQQNNRTNNRTLSLRGETRTLMEWSGLLGLKRQTIQSRLMRGWSVERALTAPLRALRKPRES